LTVRDAQTILTNPAFGISSAPLASNSKLHVGDIDIGGKFSVFDSFGGSTEARMSPQGLNFRSAVGVTFRLPTARSNRPTTSSMSAPVAKRRRSKADGSAIC